MEENFNLIYQTSFENDSFLELQKYCTKLMSKETEKNPILHQLRKNYNTLINDHYKNRHFEL